MSDREIQTTTLPIAKLSAERLNQMKKRILTGQYFVNDDDAIKLINMALELLQYEAYMEAQYGKR